MMSGILQAWGTFVDSLWGQMSDEDRSNLALAAIVLVSFATLLPGFRLKRLINEGPRSLDVRHFQIFPHSVVLCSFWAWTLSCAAVDTCGRLFFIFNASMASYELLLIVAYTLYGTSEGDKDKAFVGCFFTGLTMIILSGIFFGIDGSSGPGAMQFIATFFGILASVSPAISFWFPCGGWLGSAADMRVFVGGKADMLLLLASPINAALWIIYASKDPVAQGLKVQASFGVAFGLGALYFYCISSSRPPPT